MSFGATLIAIVAILAYTLSVLIHRHRGEATWPSWISLGGFTVFSVAANAAHAMAIQHPDIVQGVVGIAAAAAAPIAVFTSTEQLARLVIGDPRHLEPVPGELVLEEVAAAVSAAPAHKAIEAAGSDGQESPGSRSPGPGLPEENPGPGVSAGDCDPMQPERAVPDAEPRSEPGASDLEPLQAWVAGELEAGRNPTGRSAGEFLGVSERTGRNRLNELRRAMPSLFEAALPAAGGL